MQMVKLQNSFIRSEMLVAPYSKSTQLLLQKMELEQKSYETLEKGIFNLLTYCQVLDKCQEEIRIKCGWIMSEIVNEEKLNKLTGSLTLT